MLCTAQPVMCVTEAVPGCNPVCPTPSASRGAAPRRVPIGPQAPLARTGPRSWAHAASTHARAPARPTASAVEGGSESPNRAPAGSWRPALNEPLPTVVSEPAGEAGEAPTRRGGLPGARPHAGPAHFSKIFGIQRTPGAIRSRGLNRSDWAADRAAMAPGMEAQRSRA